MKIYTNISIAIKDCERALQHLLQKLRCAILMNLLTRLWKTGLADVKG